MMSDDEKSPYVERNVLLVADFGTDYPKKIIPKSRIEIESDVQHLLHAGFRYAGWSSTVDRFVKGTL